METFRATKKKFKYAFLKILKDRDSYEIGEAALTAYSHKNFLIDWLFWERLKVAYKYAVNNGIENKKILDFGCGSGVLSYMLAKENHYVTACDVEFSPLELLKKSIVFPSNINFIEGDILNKNTEDFSYDIIYAMDVLEHIDNIEPYIKLFDRLLSPNGVIIISGPTENILYKIGRKIAGNRFTGDYHITNISKIKKEISNYLEVKPLKKLLFPFIFFEVFIAHKSNSDTTSKFN